MELLKVFNFSNKKSNFLEIIEGCLNLGIRFCITRLVLLNYKKVVRKKQFWINHASHLKKHCTKEDDITLIVICFFFSQTNLKSFTKYLRLTLVFMWKAPYGKSIISIFQAFFASTNKIFLLAGRLVTRLSFYEV